MGVYNRQCLARNDKIGKDGFITDSHDRQVLLDIFLAGTIQRREQQ